MAASVTRENAENQRTSIVPPVANRRFSREICSGVTGRGAPHERQYPAWTETISQPCWPHLRASVLWYAPPLAQDPMHPMNRWPALAEFRSLGVLAVPIIITQFAQMGMGVADAIMAGRVSATDLAGIALGGNLSPLMRQAGIPVGSGSV